MTSTVTSGCARQKGAVSSATVPDAVGTEPIRSRPLSPVRRWPASLVSASRSARIRCAHTTIRSPSGVSPSYLRPRSTRGTSSSSSSLRTASERAGWET